jgi:hypothetical protein
MVTRRRLRARRRGIRTLLSRRFVLLQLLKALPEGWQEIEDRGGWFATDPAVTSNPGARGEDSPLAVLL